MKHTLGGLIVATLLASCGGGGNNSSPADPPANTPPPPPPSSTTAADVTTFKNDVARTGQYLTESTLTTANVNSTSFGLLHNTVVDGKVDAQPLFLSQLTVKGAAHNVVFVATEHDSVYAIDADSGSPLWQVSLLASGEVLSGSQGCSQVVPEIGITSTPVIDRTAGPHGALYVVAMSLDKSSNYHQRLHALDVTTGAELPGSPTEITGTFTFNGSTTTFDPGQYEERAALLLSGGVIYTTWTSHCDIAPYGGWVIAFKQSDLSRAAVINVAPGSNPNTAGGPSGDDSQYSRNGPAIWMSGDGPAADAAGNIYFLTGNGRFETTLDANGFPNQGDYGNAFVKLSPSGSTLTVADYFATFNAVHLSAQDQDLGSGGEMLLPDLTDSTNTVRRLVVGAGKDGKLYVVDRDNMGKFNSNRNAIWQEVDGALGGSVRSSPAYFNGNLYYGASGATLKAFSVTNAKVSSAATSQSTATFGYPGTSAAISANGTTNGIVWAHENSSSNGQAVLHAYDAANLATELYNNTQATGNRDQIGTGNKFITPTVAAGRVFVGTTNSVAIFGLLH
ncbi:MAG: pyrrolo-quinoline quinone [Proteobacteria bacterium]|nr:pyrrolo-quinoline quinone [Pseudomonadota bacterium]